MLFWYMTKLLSKVILENDDYYFCLSFWKNYILKGNMNPLQDLDISTEGHFEKQVFNPFDFQKVLIDEGNDPDINFFNDKSETIDSPYR